jgi:hypothetical protein
MIIQKKSRFRRDSPLIVRVALLLMRVLSGCLRGGHGVRGSAVAARTAEYGVYRSGHADAVALTAVFLAAGAAAAGTMP